jgi:hypothetical protein
VDYVVEKLTTVVRGGLREMSPLYEMVKEGVDLSKMQWVTTLTVVEGRSLDPPLVARRNE